MVILKGEWEEWHPKMPSERRFADVRRQLENYGWKLVRIAGSHHMFEKPGRPLLVIPVHKNKVKPAYGKKIDQACQE